MFFAKCHSTKANIVSILQAGVNDTQADANSTTDETLTQVNDTKTDAPEKVEPGQSAADVNQTQADRNSTAKQVKKEIKKKMVKEEVSSKIDILDQSLLSNEVLTASKDKLRELDEKYCLLFYLH